MKEIILGLIAGLVPALAMMKYAITMYKEKEVESNLATWISFNLIGLAVLVNLILTKAGWNILTASLVMVVDVVILWIMINKGVRIQKNFVDYFCASLAIISLICFWFVKGNENYEQAILLIPVLANTIASVPAMLSGIKNPQGDRPGMYMLFMFYSLSYFAVPEGQWGGQVVALAMLVTPAMIYLPLVIYRVKNNIPLKEWI